VPRTGLRRRGLALLLLWAGGAGVAVVLVLLAPAAASVLPAHRVLLFSLGIPLLAVAGVTWVARLVATRRGGAGMAAAAILVGAALAGNIVLGRAALRPDREGRARQFRDAAVAGRYLDRLESVRPVIFPFADPGFRFYRSVVRAALPARWVASALGYLGSPRDLLVGRPTLRAGDDAFNETSLEYWDAVRPVVAEAPIVVVLDSLNPPGAARGGTRAGPGVTVLGGPPGDPGPAPVVPEPSPAGTAADLALAVGILAVAGLGWAAALVPAGWLGRVALAPALGIGTIIPAGVAADRLGLVAPGSRRWVLAAIAVAGWALAAAVRFRHGRSAA
jgi:hypothetical protein